MKKSLRLLVSGLLIGTLFLTSCGQTEKPAETPSETQEAETPANEATPEETTDSGSETDEAKEKVKIGILQLVTHNALDNSRNGFMEALAERGYVEGENVEYVYLNAEDDQSNLTTMSQKIVSDNCDLALAISTPAAVSLATDAKGSDMPILITAVTDPVDAKLMTDIEKPGGNITGTSDLTPIQEQLELLKEIIPEVKKLGIIYSSKESNSKFQADIAESVAASLGWETEVKTITSTNDLAQVAESIVNDVDAIYVPTDNTIAAAMPTLTSVTNTAKIPVVAGETDMTKLGGLCSVSISYHELGRKTGEMAADILDSKSVPADMPIEYAPNNTKIFNKKTFETLGIELPESLTEGAEIIE